MRGLLGKKIGMTRVFDEYGHMVPVTVLEAGPCIITQLKTVSNDGYEAVQVGYLDKKSKHLSKALKGHFKKSGVVPKKIIAEFTNRIKNLSKFDRENLEPLVNELIKSNNTNFKGVGQPLRIALTGSKYGPGIYDIIISLGKDEVLKRLGNKIFI